MIEAFLAAGFLVWTILGIETILLLYWIDREYSGLATGSILVAGAALQWLCKIDIIGYIALNPAIVGYAVGGYFVLGTIWSVIKWWFFVKAERRRYDEFKANFLRRQGVEGLSIPEDLRQKFKDSLEDLRYENKIEIRPQVGNHKARIYLWMAYWPWSMIWTIINDPVRRVFTEIYTQIKATLQRISDHIWKGTEDDFKIPKKPKKSDEDQCTGHNK